LATRLPVIKASGGLMREHLSPDSFNRYREHIDIDVRTNAWQSLFVKLLRGNPVLKVASPKVASLAGYRQRF
jgi:hypothetical protein